MIDLYFSHRRPLVDIAVMIGYGAGTRAEEYQTNYTSQQKRAMVDDISIDFLDHDFETPNTKVLLKIAEEVSPEFVVCPDLFEEEDFDKLKDTCHEVEQLGATPIVVPKCDIDFNKFDDDWRLAYSVDSKYGNTPVDISSFTGRDIHLLGGSPLKQFRLAETAIENGVSIVSADTNSFAAAASYGNIVNYPTEVIGDGNAWIADVDHYDEWKGRIVVSLVHYYEAWRLWCQRNQ